MQLKKVAAVALGAIMTGLTLVGPALAADYTLGSFPAPFVEDNTPNFIIAIGSAGTASGIASDMVGAIDIGTRLGGESVTTSGGDSGTTVDSGVKIAASGNDLNYGEDIYDIKPTGYSYSEFPTLLKKGTYVDNEVNKNDETYTQDLDFTNGVGIVKWDTDDNDDDQPAGSYMYFQDGSVIYTYSFEFTNDIDVASDVDMESTEIELLGKTYTISDVTFDTTNDKVTKIELLGGSTETTGNDETPVTMTVNGKEYTVTPSIYSGTSSTFTVEYDGTTETTDELAEGETYELDDGTEIGVRDILYSTKETKTSAVTFYVGAQKITLDESAEVKLNDDTLDDYDTVVTITEGGTDKMTKLQLTLAPEDDIWLGEGEEWVDPVFGAWKIMFTGVTKNTETIMATASGDDGEISIYDIAGNKIEIPVISNDDKNGEAYLGDELIGTAYDITVDGRTEATTGEAGNMMLTDNDMCDAASDITACEGVYFLAVNSGGEARVIEIDDVDTTNDHLDFKDHTTGESWTDKSYVDGTATPISLGSFMDITVLVDESAYSINMTDINTFSGDAATAIFKTSLSGEVEIDASTTVVEVELFEDNGNSIFSFDFLESSDDLTIDNIESPDGTSATLERETEDSDIKWALDNKGAVDWGALLKYDSEDKDDLTITYPEEAAIADVYIAPAGATSTTSTGDVTRSGVIKTSIASVDTDVTTAQKNNKNVILVGGPCVNKLTAEALGMDFPTCGSASGIPENGYMIKLVKDAFATGKYAMVIAGWEAENTQAACAKVQANMAGMTGTEYTYPSA